MRNSSSQFHHYPKVKLRFPVCVFTGTIHHRIYAGVVCRQLLHFDLMDGQRSSSTDV